MIHQFAMKKQSVKVVFWLHLLLLSAASTSVSAEDLRTQLGNERVVLQTSMGDIEIAFFPTLAPITAAHILKLFKLGCYNSNHFFRVDKGFVAQIADVVGGRQEQLDARQLEEGDKAIPGETSDVPHVRGILSMARHDDPNSGKSSFSILLGNAPHLDGNYAVFGRVVRGDEVLARMEQVETTTEGIFVMPKERITIVSTYVYVVDESSEVDGSDGRIRKLEELTSETSSSASILGPLMHVTLVAGCCLAAYKLSMRRIADSARR